MRGLGGLPERVSQSRGHSSLSGGCPREAMVLSVGAPDYFGPAPHPTPRLGLGGLRGALAGHNIRARRTGDCGKGFCGQMSRGRCLGPLGPVLCLLWAGGSGLSCEEVQVGEDASQTTHRGNSHHWGFLPGLSRASGSVEQHQTQCCPQCMGQVQTQTARFMITSAFPSCQLSALPPDTWIQLA